MSGFNLPPGCTYQQLDDAVGANDPRPEFDDAIHDLFAPIVEWAWKQVSDAYAKGYQDGQADAAEAMRYQEEKKQ